MWSCDVTAYWLVDSRVGVEEGEKVEGESEYRVGTTERKYWNLWKLEGVEEMVRSRGLRREG
jgi:hypothetical protein